MCNSHYENGIRPPVLYLYYAPVMRPKEFNEKDAGKEFSSALLNDFRQNY